MAALIASVLLLALNGFFVAAEFALVKCRVTQLDRALRRGDRRAAAAKVVLGRLDRYLSVTQFGITVASLGLGWIGEPALARLGDGVAISLTGEELGRFGHVLVDVGGLGLLTFLHLLLGELVPKFVAIQHAEATTLNTAIPLQIVNTVFWPVLWVLEKAQRGVLRLIHINPDIANEGVLSEEEIVGILAASARSSSKRGKDLQRIVEHVLRLAHRPLRQMMIPRVDVVSLAIDSTVGEARDVLKNHGFSRILLFDESLDHVAGYLYAKDLLLADLCKEEENRTLRGLERHVHVLPETLDGFSALRKMQRISTQFAVVVDEYGGTSGIVTLEDLVEEIVGDIRDELDAAEVAKVVRVQAEVPAWEVDARTTIDELRDAGVPIGDEEQLPHHHDDEISRTSRDLGKSLGALVHTRLGHLPRIGDIVTLAGDVVVEVIATSRRRIERLRVSVNVAAPTEATAAAQS